MGRRLLAFLWDGGQPPREGAEARERIASRGTVCARGGGSTAGEQPGFLGREWNARSVYSPGPTVPHSELVGMFAKLMQDAPPATEPGTAGLPREPSRSPDG